MGGKAQAPAAPDFTPIMKASLQQSQLNYDLGNKQLDWAKQQYASDKGVTDQIVGSMKANMDQNTQDAKDYSDRYKNTFEPLQDQYITKAENYNTPSRVDFNMGQAQAGVATQFDAARENAQKDLESYGINPSSTRFAALDLGSRTQQAAATAAAGTKSALDTEATGNNMLLQANQLGAGLPAASTAASNTATAAGSAASGTQLATTASGANTMGTNTQYQQIGANDLSAAAGAMNTGYQDSLAQFNANQNTSSGLGSVLGMAGGIIAKSVFHLADGGAIPAGSSPSGGAIPDDVNAKLSSDEFVMPKSAVQWFGQKTMYDMIDKAQKQRAEMTQQTGAIPNVHPAAIPAQVAQPAIPAR